MSKEPHSNESAAPTNQPNEGGEFREHDEFNVREVHGAIMREKSEPHDGFAPIPLWLVAFFMALILWGGVYLTYYSGGFKSTVFDRNQRGWGAEAVASAPKGPPDPMVLGKRVFTANCAACHQPTGLGVPGAFPPLAGSEWVLGGDWHGDNHLVRVVLHGLQGPIDVEGKTFNGVMPPWQQLKDEEIAAVLTYIRNSWGNSASHVTAEQVAKVRADTANHPTPFTEADLKAIPAEKFEAAPAPAEPSAPGAEAPAAGSEAKPKA